MTEPDITRINELEAMLSAGGRIAVTAHTHPDGDALGSVTAMRSYLQHRGLDVTAVLPDAYPDTIAFIDADKGTVIAPEHLDFDLIICLDFNNFSRCGVLETALKESKAGKILIDHHLSPDSACFDLVFSDTEVSSTCELLYYILKKMPDIEGRASELPALCAAALMSGMTTDSNNFANSVFPTTLQMASELLEAGVDRDRIIHELYFKYSENRIRAFAWLLGEKMKICADGVAYIIINREDAARFSIGDGETEGLVNIPLSIDRVKISALLKEDDGYFRVSLRSLAPVAVNGLASAHFHGGGHRQASGGRIYIPGDVPSREGLAGWFEEKTAQFMQQEGLL